MFSLHTNRAKFDCASSVTIEWLYERTEHLDIFLLSAHHSMVFYCLLVEGECQILMV